MKKVGRPAGREFPIKQQTPVTEDMHNEIAQWAKHEGLSQPAFVRKAIQQYIALVREWSETPQEKR